jgi:biotin carboxyl carrier protein
VNFEIQAPASGVLRAVAPVNTPVVPGKAIAQIETEG